MQPTFEERVCAEVISRLKIRLPNHTISAGPAPRTNAQPYRTYGFYFEGYYDDPAFERHICHTLFINAALTLESLTFAELGRTWFHMVWQGRGYAAMLTIAPAPTTRDAISDE